MKKAMLTILTLLMFPQAAHADPLPPAVPGAFCDYYAPAICYAHSTSDEHRVSYGTSSEWILVRVTDGARDFSSTRLGCTMTYFPPVAAPFFSGSCRAVRGLRVYHRWLRYHDFRTNSPYLDANFGLFASDDGAVVPLPGYKPRVFYDARYDSIDCEAYTRTLNDNLAPTADAPAEVIATCFPNYVPPTPTTTTGTTTTTTTTDDGNNGHGDETDGTDESNPGQRCEHVRMRRIGTVRLFRRNANCGIAIGLARSVTRGNPVAGWSCTIQHIGRVRAGRCVRSGGARSGNIVGLRWRV